MKLERAPGTANETLSAPKEPLAGDNLATLRTNVVNSILGSVESVRKEVDDVLADMKVFSQHEPDMVMKATSAHSARLIEVIVQCGRIEAVRREWKPVREECDRVLNELKSQFQIASRLMAMRQMDWDMSGRGQT